MKRIGSMFLATVLLFTCFTVTVTAEEATQTVPDISMYEMQVLHDLGVFEKDASSYDMNKSVTRAEFAYIVARFMDKTRAFSRENMEISDIEDEYIYAPVINYVLKNEVMSLDATRKFRPLADITGSEAIKAFVAMLGYNPRVEVYGKNQNAYLKVIREMGLSNTGISWNDTKVTYKTLVQTLYDSLEIPILEIESVTKKNGEYIPSYSNRSGEIPLTAWHNVCVVKDLLTHIELGATTTEKTGYEQEIVQIGETLLKLGDVDAEQYIGYRVKAYYDKDTMVLKSVIPDVIRNETIIISAEDISSFDDGVLTYYKDNRQKQITIPASSDIVYNGRAVKYDQRKDAVKIDEGYIVINKFSGIDTKILTLVTEYTNFIIGAKTEDYVIYDALSNDVTLSVNPNEVSVKFIDEEGNDITYSDLSIGDVLTINKSMDGKRVRAQRSNKKVTGTVSKVINKNSKMLFVIDDVEYFVAPSYIKLSPSYPRVGEEVTISLDARGKIAKFEAAKPSEWKFAFLKNVIAKDEAFNEHTLQLKIFADGEMKIYDSIKKLRVDNAVATSASDAMTKIGTYMNNEYGFIDEKKFHQPIRFTTNAKGLVTKIDTCYWNQAAGESRDSLRYIYRNAQPYAYTGSSGHKAPFTWGTKLELYLSSVLNFNRKVVTNSDIATMMTVGYHPSVPDKYYKNYMGLYAGGAFVIDGLTATADNLRADFMVTYVDPDYILATDDFGVVTDVWQGYDEEDDEVKTQIHFIDRGGVEATVFVDTSVLDLDANGCTLSKGDFFRYRINRDDDIMEYQVLFDAETQRWFENIYASEETFEQHEIFHAYILQKQDTVIRFTETNPKTLLAGWNSWSEDEKFEQLNGAAVNNASSYGATANAAIYVWDSSKESLTKATNAEIIPFTQSFDESSETVIYSIKGVERLIVIYK